MQEDPYQKRCKYKFCRIEFRAKRTNQEFCCREHYVKHNNLIAKNERDETKIFDKILHRNREILIMLLDKDQVTKDELITLGYKFNYFTNLLKKKNGNNIISCYEYLLELIDNNKIKISKYG